MCGSTVGSYLLHTQTFGNLFEAKLRPKPDKLTSRWQGFCSLHLKKRTNQGELSHNILSTDGKYRISNEPALRLEIEKEHSHAQCDWLDVCHA